jgi:hypothetical protein
MRSSTRLSNPASAQCLTDAGAYESNEQRRVRLQALLTDLLDMRRLAAFQLAQTQRVIADCETAVTRLSAILRDLTGESETMSPREEP